MTTSQKCIGGGCTAGLVLWAARTVLLQARCVRVCMCVCVCVCGRGMQGAPAYASARLLQIALGRTSKASQAKGSNAIQLPVPDWRCGRIYVCVCVCLLSPDWCCSPFRRPFLTHSLGRFLPEHEWAMCEVPNEYLFFWGPVFSFVFKVYLRRRRAGLWVAMQSREAAGSSPLCAPSSSRPRNHSVTRRSISRPGMAHHMKGAPTSDRGSKCEGCTGAFENHHATQRQSPTTVQST